MRWIWPIAAASAFLLGCPKAGSNGDMRYGGDARGASILIRAQRLPKAVVDRAGFPRSQRELDRIERELCESSSARGRIYYQLIVQRDWHYYWICGERDVRRAATAAGADALKRWLDQVRHHASAQRSRCPRGSTQLIGEERHDSGIVASAYCDGQLTMRYPDGGSRQLSLTGKIPISATPPAGYPAPAAGYPQPQAPYQAPACPQPDPRQLCRGANERAYKQGMSEACSRICKEIYKKCRSLNPNTSLCHQVSDHCSKLPGTCK